MGAPIPSFFFLYPNGMQKAHGGVISPQLFQALWLALKLPLSYQHFSIMTLMDIVCTHKPV